MRNKIKLFVSLMIVFTVIISGSFIEEISASEKIVIGNLQDMSGPTSVWSSAVTKGAELAVEIINREGGVLGKEIELITYDTELNVQEAISGYYRLVDRDGAVAVVGAPISADGVALSPIAEDERVPMFGSWMDERATTKEDGSPYKYSFLIQPSSTQQAQFMASYAMNELNMNNFGVLYNEANPYSVSLAEPFEKYVEELGGEIVYSDTFGSDDRDFRTQITRILNNNPDAIYIPNYIEEITLIVEQTRAMGIDVPFLAGLDAAPPFAELAGDHANNVYYVDNVDLNDEELKEIAEEYVSKFGEEPVNKSYLGYDSILATVEAIKIAGSTNPQDIAEAGAKIENLEVTTGNLSISPENHRPYGLSMPIFEIVDGEYKLLNYYIPEKLK
ncbi:MAG TPA: ABC transporter substrate-binding protein [Halanaerobiales bacterium]|nr:ABC transporter substrate-binding protein [Halanaerobiales bacterium]